MGRVMLWSGSDQRDRSESGLAIGGPDALPRDAASLSARWTLRATVNGHGSRYGRSGALTA